MTTPSQPDRDPRCSERARGSAEQPVTVRVATATGWTGPTLEQIEAVSRTAAQQWDERNWRRA